MRRGDLTGRRARLLLLAAGALWLCGCGVPRVGAPGAGATDAGATDAGTTDGGTAAATWFHPAPGTTWQWQLTGTVNTSYDAALYDIDLFDSPASLIASLQAKGRKVVCYFSAGSDENWRPDAGEFKAADLGKPLSGWAGERWVDVRSANVRRIMRARLDLAVQKGCDGVEPDNVDGYANPNGLGLTAADQLDYDRFLATEAHARGLAVALKNDLDQVAQLEGDFDFALNEQCFQYQECGKLKAFVDAGKAVLNAEYKKTYRTDAAARAALCQKANQLGLSTLVLPVALDDSFRFSCR